MPERLITSGTVGQCWKNCSCLYGQSFFHTAKKFCMIWPWLLVAAAAAAQKGATRHSSWRHSAERHSAYARSVEQFIIKNSGIVLKTFSLQSAQCRSRASRCAECCGAKKGAIILPSSRGHRWKKLSTSNTVPGHFVDLLFHRLQ